MDFVVAVLMTELGLSRKDALQTMIRVHLEGGVLIPLPSEADAIRVSSQVSQISFDQGYPLVCRFVDFRQSRSQARAN